MSEGQFADLTRLVRPLEELERKKNDLIKIKVTQQVGVDVRRPRWMPDFVWRWMWRQVTVTEGPMEFEWDEKGADQHSVPSQNRTDSAIDVSGGSNDAR